MKQFKNLILAGALVLGLAGFAVSCDKYGDDIDELTSRVGKLETQLTDLQTKIDAGVIVTGVTQTAGGVTIQTSNGTYTITNGEKGEKGEKGDKGDQGEKGQGSVVTLGENGNWFIDGVDTGISYKGEKGDKGEDGKDGEDGKASVVEIGENGNWFIDGVDTGVKAGADGALSAVWDPEAGTLTLKNVEGYEGDYVLNLTAAGVTSVELVASIDGANITNKINFATVTEKENVFGIVDPEDGKTLLPGGLKFTEGAETQRDVNVIVRVSPVNYTLKAEDISFQNGNGETLDWVKVVSVEPYKRLYTATRAGEPETGLWKIKVALAKDYVKKDFEAATKVGKKNILFAVKAQDAISTYDVAFVYEVPKPLSWLDVVVDNDRNIDDINNRYYGSGRLSGQNYYITSKSFDTDKERVFTYKEKAWKDAAYTKTTTDNFVEATGKVATDMVQDDRNGELAYDAVQGTPITITIPTFKSNGDLDKDKSGRLIPNENIRAMYVTLDYEACAVESAPSEWVSWNSYTYTGLNEVVEGAETEIIIDSERAINDFIGFRVYAVNYDGTLVDPDGRAFYVKLGTDAPAVDWNKGTVPATTVTPKANPKIAKYTAKNTSSTDLPVSLTAISGAVSYTLEPAKAGEPVPFDVTLASEDSKTSYVFKVGGTFEKDNASSKLALADVDFTKLTKVSTTPTVDWKELVDGKTYTAVLTIKDNVGSALATLTVSMTKKMPETDPEGAFEFKSDLLVDNTLYTYLIPHEDYYSPTETWVANKANFGKLKDVINLYNVSAEQLPNYKHVGTSDKVVDLIFANSYWKDENNVSVLQDNYVYDKDNGSNPDLVIANKTNYKLSTTSKPYQFIDSKTPHATYVAYNYGPITSVTSGEKVYTGDKAIQDALKDLDGKAGTFRVKEGNDVNYYVKVFKVNTVYCSVYGRGYSWNWATREQLAALGYTDYTKTDNKGAYTTPFPPKENVLKGYVSEVTIGATNITISPKFICGTSSWDGRYNRNLDGSESFSSTVAAPDGFLESLAINPKPKSGKTAYVVTNGTINEYYEVEDVAKVSLTSDITLKAIDIDNNVTRDVAATLVIECLDMYGNEVQVKVPFTIKKR